jgi:hypothetical protein
MTWLFEWTYCERVILYTTASVWNTSKLLFILVFPAQLGFWLWVRYYSFWWSDVRSPCADQHILYFQVQMLLYLIFKVKQNISINLSYFQGLLYQIHYNYIEIALVPALYQGFEEFHAVLCIRNIMVAPICNSRYFFDLQLITHLIFKNSKTCTILS